MESAFQGSAGCDLAERLMLALDAGQEAGGDKRGRQSAALKVYAGEEYAVLDLRVDEHTHPVAELRRVLTIARLQLSPFMRICCGAVAPPAPCRRRLPAFCLPRRLSGPAVAADTVEEWGV
jgi:uncharacterized Ntn-hydrolase superfamily protein